MIQALGAQEFSWALKKRLLNFACLQPPTVPWDTTLKKKSTQVSFYAKDNENLNISYVFIILSIHTNSLDLSQCQVLFEYTHHK